LKAVYTLKEDGFSAYWFEGRIIRALSLQVRERKDSSDRSGSIKSRIQSIRVNSCGPFMKTRRLRKNPGSKWKI